MYRLTLWVNLAFLLLISGMGGMLYLYWNERLEPRLEAEGRFQARVIAYSQARTLADHLVEPLPPELRREWVTDAVDEILTIEEPGSQRPFIEGISITVDYDALPLPPGWRNR